MRSFRLPAVLLLASTLVLGGASHAFAHSGDTVTFVDPPTEGTLVASGTDFAEHTFGDPWDMSDPGDISTHSRRLDHQTFSGGVYSAEVTGVRPYLYVMWGGYPIAAPLGRDGIINRVDTSKYKFFWIRLYSSRADHAWLAWNYTQDLKAWHDRVFFMQEGWHTYLIDLSGDSEWSGQPINLRLDLTDNGAGAHVKIDWMRLTTVPSSALQIQMADSEPTGTVDLYHDADTSSYDGDNIASVASGPTFTYDWDVSRLPLGPHYLYGRKGDDPWNTTPSDYSGPVTVDAPPAPVIIDPNAFGDHDYATEMLHNPWDFNTRSDIARSAFISGARFSGGVYSGVNTNNDPYFYLHVHRIPSKYHRLSIRYKFSGTRNVGRGTIARFVWYIAGRAYKPQVTADLVGETGWNTYTFDIARIRRAAGSLGWRNYVDRLRFDPHEDRNRRWFYVNYIRLNQDDRCDPFFDVQYQVRDTDDDTVTVSLYRDTDTAGYDGQPIFTDVQVPANTLQKYRWTPGDVHGKFYLYMVASDRVGTGKIYATGPLVAP